MNKNLIEKLNHLHDSFEHHEIIQIIEELPANEIDYELKNILARAYNNIDAYDKAIEILLQESNRGSTDSLWNLRVGYALFYKDEEEKALPYFQRSLELGCDDAQVFIEDCMECIEEKRIWQSKNVPQTKENQQPEEIEQTDITLNEIGWTFSNKHYSNAEAFNQDVAEYQKDFSDTDENWKPEEIVSDFPELQIQYMAWISKPSDLLENETLIEEDKSVFEEYPDQEEYQVEILAKLKANNAKNFSALEFLMKAHNQQANKELDDHVFFEGTDTVPKIINGLPTYYIACGS